MDSTINDQFFSNPARISIGMMQLNINLILLLTSEGKLPWLKKLALWLLYLLFLTIISHAAVVQATATEEIHNHYIVKLAGTGSMYKMTMPGFDEEAMCFDIDLIDMKSSDIVGTAIDCLSDVQSKANGISLIGTTFFRLPEGILITRGKVSVQPVLEETISESGQTYTHITGASSSGNTIITGTGIFADSSGNARLSGMVDMSSFAMNEGDLLTFNCLFEIHLDFKSMKPEVLTSHDFRKNERYKILKRDGYFSMFNPNFN